MMSRLPLSWKIALPVLTVAAFALLLALTGLTALRTAMLDERLRGIDHMTDAAVAVAESFHALEQSGAMTRDEAQAAARQAVGAMRFDNGNYIFVLGTDGVNKVHPKQDLIGASMLDMKDKAGTYFVRELVTAARNGGGMVKYFWPRAAAEEPIAKYGWGELFAPWDWVFGTGAYADDLDAAFWAQAGNILIISAIGAVIVGFIAFATVRSVTRPILGLTANMRALADGDADVVVEGDDRRDEIGHMAAAMKVFVDNENARRKLVEAEQARQQDSVHRAAEVQRLCTEFDQQISALMGTITSSVGGLQKASREMTEGAQLTTEQSRTVANAAQEASSNVETVAAAAEELSSSVSEINRQVTTSNEIAAAAAREADSTNERMTELSEAAGRIGEVISLIQAIAEQTNLLALNATIEAARAGEAGRGFAVVAAEVKELANQTTKATEQIASQITAIQGETSQAVEAISSVTTTISRMNEIASAIAAAVEEQGAATNEIARNVSEASRGTAEVTGSIASVSRAADGTRAAASSVDSAARRLEDDAETLRAQVSAFLQSVRAQSDAA